jgi:ribosome-associated heat shock protein Hsp15
MSLTEKVRIDKYLWAIRIFKTRSLASRSIEEGQVTMFGQRIKASHPTKIGEQYEIETTAKSWVIEVTGILEKRLGAALAIGYYKDLSPLPEKKEKTETFFFYTGKRRSKIGRPTKKSRRELDDFTGS